LCVNRGKKSITLDISSEEGQNIVKDLAKECDIVVENYKVGALAKYGLTYEDLSKENPKIIYASVTGFGQDGPRATSAAYDFMIQALGGLMSVTGESDERPGGGPQKVGVPIVDLMTGMYTAISVLAALANREVTGKGDYIDIAMLDVQTAFLANQAMNYLVSGKAPKRNGNSHPNIQPQNVYPTSDGHIAIAVGNDGQFERFANEIGCAELAQDARFQKNAGRVENLPELEAIILEKLATESTRTWVSQFEQVGVPCGPINTVPEVFEDEQVKHRGMITSIDHPQMGKVPQVVSPMRFSRSSLRFDSPPPVLSEHTDEVLSNKLGYTKEHIEQLRRDNVI
jgi:crotonobetainyl-CoA:carnitine CoA-transferase CaiB-like acyl-CoA transferase